MDDINNRLIRATVRCVLCALRSARLFFSFQLEDLGGDDAEQNQDSRLGSLSRSVTLDNTEKTQDPDPGTLAHQINAAAPGLVKLTDAESAEETPAFSRIDNVHMIQEFIEALKHASLDNGDLDDDVDALLNPTRGATGY
jgi:hypothetical protein